MGQGILAYSVDHLKRGGGRVPGSGEGQVGSGRGHSKFQVTLLLNLLIHGGGNGGTPSALLAYYFLFTHQFTDRVKQRADFTLHFTISIYSNFYSVSKSRVWPYSRFTGGLTSLGSIYSRLPGILGYPFKASLYAKKQGNQMRILSLCHLKAYIYGYFSSYGLYGNKYLFQILQLSSHE